MPFRPKKKKTLCLNITRALFFVDVLFLLPERYIHTCEDKKKKNITVVDNVLIQELTTFWMTLPVLSSQSNELRGQKEHWALAVLLPCSLSCTGYIMRSSTDNTARVIFTHIWAIRRKTAVALCKSRCFKCLMVDGTCLVAKFTQTNKPRDFPL